MFKHADLEDITKEIYNLNVSKAKYFVDIPTKIIMNKVMDFFLNLNAKL